MPFPREIGQNKDKLRRQYFELDALISYKTLVGHLYFQLQNTKPIKMVAVK